MEKELHESVQTACPSSRLHYTREVILRCAFSLCIVFRRMSYRPGCREAGGGILQLRPAQGVSTMETHGVQYPGSKRKVDMSTATPPSAKTKVSLRPTKDHARFP